MDAKTEAMSPQDRIAAGLCPECGVPLEGLSPIGHAASHWNHPIRPNGLNGEAIAREQMLYDHQPKQESK